MPLVTVVIPAFNAAGFIRGAMASVLGQTWKRLECIVVDDGSTDGTAEIVRATTGRRLRYVHKTNEGTVSTARNLGADMGRGSYIAFLDADDYWLPTKLEEQMGLALSQPEIGLVYCHYAIADQSLEPMTIIAPPAHDLDVERIVLNEANGIGLGSTGLVSRTAFEKIGGFRAELSVSADLDFLARIAAEFPLGGVDRCLVLYRSHPGQMHADLTALEHDNMWILNEHQGSIPDKDRAYRRGVANLQTRLFFYSLRRGDMGRARRALQMVMRSRPDRLVRLPTEAIMRRAWRRRSDRRGLPALRDDLARAHDLRVSRQTAPEAVSPGVGGDRRRER